MRCGRCFYMNVFEARHCSGCGTELGLEPTETTSALRCPTCKVELVAVDAGVGSVLDCGRCGGQFVDHGTLRALLERKPRPESGRAGGLSVDNPLRHPVVYRACPHCAELMSRKNFGRRSGVIVDVCSPHGTWFDAEELPRVLAFVENGGLERAERLEETERRERARRDRGPSSDPSRVPPAFQDVGRATDLAEGVAELLGFVVSVVWNYAKRLR